MLDIQDDTSKSKEGGDLVKETYCEGCDCESTTRQASDSHCCSEDGYVKDASSAESDNDPTVTAVVPSKSVPLAVAVNATSGGVIAVVANSDSLPREVVKVNAADGGAHPFSDHIQKWQSASTVMALLRISGLLWSITTNV